MPDGGEGGGPARRSTSYLQASLDKLGEYGRRDDMIEVCINPDGQVWGEVRGDHFMRLLDVRLRPREIKDLGDQIASASGSTLSAKRPIISVSIAYRGRPIRAQVIRPPAVGSGVSISLRFFSTLPLDRIELRYLYGQERSLEGLREMRNRQLRDVVERGDITEAVRFCVAHKLNMVVSGGSSTGKTVATRKILSYVPPEERIVTIEEGAELLPEQPNVVTLISDRDAEHLSADVMLTSTLRMRPDRIVLGEVRGKEAMTFLEVINTGHGGSMTTLHAETPHLAVRRLAIAALKGGEVMTYSDMVEYIEGTIDVIVQVGREGGRHGIVEFYLPRPHHRIRGPIDPKSNTERSTPP